MTTDAFKAPVNQETLNPQVQSPQGLATSSARRSCRSHAGFLEEKHMLCSEQRGHLKHQALSGVTPVVWAARVERCRTCNNHSHLNNSSDRPPPIIVLTVEDLARCPGMPALPLAEPRWGSSSGLLWPLPGRVHKLQCISPGEGTEFLNKRLTCPTSKATCPCK